MVVHVVGKEPPAQPPGRNVGASRSEGGGEVGDGAVFQYCAETQDRLQGGRQGQDPKDEIFNAVSRREGDNWGGDVKAGDRPAVASGSMAQRGGSVVEGAGGTFRLVVDRGRAEEIRVGFIRREADQIPCEFFKRYARPRG